ncbi:alpha-amylase family glycosyl hydrolase [Aquimarina agarilytica]|uniref:alpha-amylase family glycosyl hydrolase n=1 Tax=Aquimarina agarilytica TaxID=1087449 RepID=UPI0002880ED0|nr:alpha-amylase family glycosyl hydrolase [Aquimarina agarilytica]
MKKISLFIITVLIFCVACKQKSTSTSNINTLNNTTLIKQQPPITNSDIASAVIYEANIRQYSPEGTFEAFTKDIPQLKQLGVKIIWLMPVFPISTTKSKGSLGSYYAVSDYTKINPEFGTLKDFKQLIQTAHDNDMYVILDWVANHTGWDHHWVSTHPEYYTKDAQGAITHTLDTDWTDVADLNYTNKQLRLEMKNAMLHWLKNENIDGFRCDVAGMVPADFWKSTIAELRQVKPIFMLAEDGAAELLNHGFDMIYGWDTHHKMNAIAQQKSDAKELTLHLKTIDSLFQKEAIIMNFVTNHDENSWNGTVKERMGAAWEAMTALTYCLPGMPLIYSGQEYGMNKRLRFFEKDTIPKTKGNTWHLLKKLGKLKNEQKALTTGKNKATFTKIITSKDATVFAFARKKEATELIYMANFSKEPISFKVGFSGKYINYLTNTTEDFNTTETIKFLPWEYKILIR